MEKSRFGAKLLEVFSFRKKLAAAGIVFLVGLISVLLAGPGVQAAADLSETEELKAFLEGVVLSQLDEKNIAGATLSLVKDGEIVLSEGYGLANLEEGVRVDPDKTLFRPGSVSKLFAFSAVMQMVEEGLLDLDEDINTYLDLEIPAEVLGKKGEPAEPITLRHLMTHTPGFEDRGEGLFFLGEENMMELEEYLRKYQPARVFPPGKVMAYSNYGSALAGYIVEKVSGQPFPQYVEDHIFGPLEMENSTFRQPLPSDLLPDLSEAYKKAGGEYHRGEFEFIPASPAGGLSSTAGDMARFMLAHLQGGSYGEQEILRPETVEEMHSQQFTHHPEIPGMTLGFIETIKNEERVLTHGGATMLFFSSLYLLKEHDLGLFVSYNGGTGLEAEQLFQAFMDRYFPAETPVLPQPDSEVRARALEYSGEYHPNRSNFTSMEKILGILQRVRIGVTADGYLTSNFMGEPIRLVELEPGLYQNRDTRGTQLIERIAFGTDPEENNMLIIGGPMTFSQVPWYGSSALLGGLTLLNLILWPLTLLGWLISLTQVIFKWKNHYATLGSVLARLIYVLFALFGLIFLLGLAGVFAIPHPAYGAPEIMLGVEPPFFEFLLSLPLVLLVLGALVLIMAIISWVRSFWTAGPRLYYSFLALSTLGFLWVLYYVQLLQIFPGS